MVVARGASIGRKAHWNSRAAAVAGADRAVDGRGGAVEQQEEHRNPHTASAWMRHCQLATRFVDVHMWNAAELEPCGVRFHSYMPEQRLARPWAPQTRAWRRRRRHHRTAAAPPPLMPPLTAALQGKQGRADGVVEVPLQCLPLQARGCLAVAGKARRVQQRCRPPPPQPPPPAVQGPSLREPCTCSHLSAASATFLTAGPALLATASSPRVCDRTCKAAPAALPPRGRRRLGYLQRLLRVLNWLCCSRALAHERAAWQRSSRRDESSAAGLSPASGHEISVPGTRCATSAGAAERRPPELRR